MHEGPHQEVRYRWQLCFVTINPLSPELNPICYLLALLAHDFLHVSRIRVKSLILRQAGRSPTEIVGSNPTGGMDICPL
jgi:transposase